MRILEIQCLDDALEWNLLIEIVNSKRMMGERRPGERCNAGQTKDSEWCAHLQSDRDVRGTIPRSLAKGQLL
jgi:hypothetical protein